MNNFGDKPKLNTAPSMRKCSLCQKEFDENEAKACKSCPINNCGLVKCPNCGYEMPKIPEKLKRWIK